MHYFKNMCFLSQFFAVRSTILKIYHATTSLIKYVTFVAFHVDDVQPGKTIMTLITVILVIFCLSYAFKTQI